MNYPWHFSKSFDNFFFSFEFICLSIKENKNDAQFPVPTQWFFRWTHWTLLVRPLCIELPSLVTCRPAASCWVMALTPPSSPYKASLRRRWEMRPCSRFWAVSWTSPPPRSLLSLPRPLLHTDKLCAPCFTSGSLDCLFVWIFFLPFFNESLAWSPVTFFLLRWGRHQEKEANTHFRFLSFNLKTWLGCYGQKLIKAHINNVELW